MDIQKTGGPAFPGAMAGTPMGMTLRDYFAAKVMASLVPEADDFDLIARDSYRLADVMLAERAK